MQATTTESTLAAWVSRERWPFLCILLAFCVLVLLREPQILLKGRVWAEDAKFFQAALDRSFPTMMAYVLPGMGYRILYQNFAAYVAAHFLPLEYAPLAFVAFALVLQGLPLALLMLARRELGLTPFWFGLAALCLVVTTPNYDLWLTTVTSGFLLSAATAVILISPVSERPRKWVYRAVLVIAASTGMPSLFLVPFFLYRSVRDRERERIVQTLVFCGAGALQAAVVLQGTGGRSYLFSTDGILAAVLTNQILLPVCGYNLVCSLIGFIDALRSQIATNNLTGLNYAFLVSATAAFVSSLYFLGVRSRRTESAYLFCSAMLMSVLSIVGSFAGRVVISLGSDSRYFYVPNMLIGVGVVLAVRTGTQLPAAARYLAFVALTWVLGIGVVEYFRFPGYFYDGPAWKEEVAAWRREPWRPIRTSPAGMGFQIQPDKNVWIYSEMLPAVISGERFKTAVSLSAGKRIAQRFQANADGLYQIEIQTVTWGRPPRSRDYPVEWELYELAAGNILRGRGTLAAATAGDWTTMRIAFPNIAASKGKWYSLALKASSNVSEDHSIGFPLYSLTPQDVQVTPATISGMEMAGSLAARLSLSYAVIRR